MNNFFFFTVFLGKYTKSVEKCLFQLFCILFYYSAWPVHFNTVLYLLQYVLVPAHYYCNLICTVSLHWNKSGWCGSEVLILKVLLQWIKTPKSFDEKLFLHSLYYKEMPWLTDMTTVKCYHALQRVLALCVWCIHLIVRYVDIQNV